MLVNTKTINVTMERQSLMPLVSRSSSMVERMSAARWSTGDTVVTTFPEHEAEGGAEGGAEGTAGSGVSVSEGCSLA